MSWVIDNSEQKLGSLLVLLVIANHAKSDGTDAWPSIRTIAREARMSESQTHRCIRKLRRSGELTVEAGAGPHGTNLYHLPKVLQFSLGGGRNLLGVPNTTKKTAEMAPEPSLTVQSQSLNLRRHKPPPSSFPCGNVEKKTAQQKRFGLIGQLSDEAERILRCVPEQQDGELAENLKTWAASKGLPYFDAWPGSATPIEQAIITARERRKSCLHALSADSAKRPCASPPAAAL
jgi:DNA-binding transcriptional MocR family regulator